MKDTEGNNSTREKEKQSQTQDIRKEYNSKWELLNPQKLGKY
jgi:hypothetical protein